MRTRFFPVLAHVLAIIAVAPLVWILISALKPAEDVFSFGWPSTWTFDNLQYVLLKIPMPRFLLNSAWSRWWSPCSHCSSTRWRRTRWPGCGSRAAGFIFSGIMSTLLVSLPVILVPLFLVAKQLGLLDSYAGLIVPSIFHAFGIFLLRQYYLNIPRELEEAADLDGCGYWRRYWSVILPLSRPMLAALSVLFFLANWNAFLWPLTITRNPDLRVIQLGISGMQGQYASAWNLILAAAVIAAIPTVVVFVAGQKRLVDAMKTTGLK